MDCSMPGFPMLHHLPELAQTHVSDVIQSSHPLLSPSPPAFNLFNIRVISSESALDNQVAKYWSFSFSINPSNNIQGKFPLGFTGLISCQSKGLKSLLPHLSSKASILPCSAFFMVQVVHPYTTTGKTIALTI